MVNIYSLRQINRHINRHMTSSCRSPSKEATAQ
jgi:hypothetical protein